MPTTGLDVTRMRLLREVGLRGSIAAAAREVGLTASAVSQQIAALERDTGLALLDRSPRGVALTGAGRLLAARAGEVADVLEAARADVERLAGTVGGVVAVSAVASAAATFVSAAVGALRDEAPGLEVVVAAAEPASSLARLLAGDAELAIVDEYDGVPLALPEGMRTTPLGDEPLVLVHPTSRRPPRRLARLGDERWVLPPEDAACGRAVRVACRAAGFEPHVSWETDDMLLLARAVADGHGITLLPRRSVAADVDGIARAAVDPAMRRRLVAVTRVSVASRPAVQTVLAALQQAARRAGR
ncbi:MAG: LysR family transcriptional regulator [Jatrophihabitans sp.]|uniref:LysR family transcriptional regulator n=1 Tax=Jatrophihabitans sp. TaxID=1932789 RepID=UPI003F7ECFEB